MTTDAPSKWPNRLRRLRRHLVRAAIVLAVLAVTVVTAAWFMPLPERLTLKDSTVVEYRDGSPAHVFLSPDDKWRMARTLDRIDPAYIEALIRLEDKRFRSHLGVDPVAILRSTKINLVRGRVVTGASTITMQLARLLEPRPRTLRSKVIEAFRALQLELHYSKDEILENYLRFVPYGRNVEGVEAAAWTYFGHSAEALTPAEIATLLAVPQGPRTRHPRPRNEQTLRHARDDIAERLLEQGALPTGRGGKRSTDAAVLADVKAGPVPTRFKPFPREASHLAYWLKQRHPAKTRIETTIDRGLQRLAENVAHGQASTLRDQGILNGAIVVLEHEVGEIRALVGNLDADAAGGQIPSFDAPRSPGSTLKSLLYAQAISEGIALPEFLVEDAPVRFGSWSPTNFDGRFDGLVRLEDALSRSLNVPFVRLLQQIGLDRFLGALHAMGAAHINATPGHYGLSAALGAVELTPLELTGIYAALAGDGLHRTPRLLRGQRPEKPLRIIAEGAAWLTRRALRKRDRPDFPRQRQMAGLPHQIFWKTGTSTGHRDAWAVGSGPRFTATVWLGNLNNAPSRALVGARTAAPVLFDVLEAMQLPADLTATDPQPSDLVPIEICAFSGYPAGTACPKLGTALALRRNVPVQTDPFHVQVEVDTENGLAVNAQCKGDRPTQVRTFIVWPSAVKRYLKSTDRALPEAPPWAPGCEPTQHTAAPHIVSPPPEQTVLLIPGLAVERQQVLLEANSRLPGDRLSWFIDGRFLGTVPADERLWWPPETGQHEIVVTDSRGRSSQRKLTVR